MKKILPLLLLSVALLGCETWRSFSPTTQAVLKAGAKLALSYGISELGDRVREVRPYQEQLKGLIETTFAKPLSPEDTGAALKAGVAKLPAAIQGAVLSQFKDSLVGAKTTAASPGNTSYNQRVAGKL